MNTNRQHIDRKVIAFEGNEISMNIHFTRSAANRENVEDYVGAITENFHLYNLFVSSKNTGFTLNYRSIVMKGYIEPVVIDGKIESVTVKVDYLNITSKAVDGFQVVHNLPRKKAV